MGQFPEQWLVVKRSSNLRCLYIYQVGEGVSTQVRDVFIQAAPILRWQDRIKNKEVLQMAVMENLREDV